MKYTTAFTKHVSPFLNRMVSSHAFPTPPPAFLISFLVIKNDSLDQQNCAQWPTSGTW